MAGLIHFLLETWTWFLQTFPVLNKNATCLTPGSFPVYFANVSALVGLSNNLEIYA